MAVDEVGLCNMALVLVGEERINALTEDNKPARFCNQHYPNIRDEVLREGSWNVATRRAALSIDAVKPVYEFTNAFQLPTDFLRLIRLENQRRDHRLEEDKILSDEGSMNIMYVFQLTDVSRMDPLLQKAIATKLAAELAIPIAQNLDLYRTLNALYTERIAEARLQDAMEGPLEVIESTSWVNARLSGVGDPTFRRITPV